MDSGVKRQMTSDESDSPTEMGDRRPKRNRRGKRAWSPSNDNSIVLETSIKEFFVPHFSSPFKRNIIFIAINFLFLCRNTV
jgi:hypothetical protein